MSEQPARDPRREFTNVILGDWEEAMDRFFQVVDKKGKKRGLDDTEIEAALQLGYGYEVAEAWLEWLEEGT